VLGRGQDPSSSFRGGVLATGLALIASLTGLAPGAASAGAAPPEITLDAEPPSAPVGDVVTVTGTVIGGEGEGHWQFSTPDFVGEPVQSDNVLDVTCLAAGADSVTATYSDDAGDAEDSVTVTCTARSTSPATTSAAPTTSASPTSQDSSSPALTSSPPGGSSSSGAGAVPPPATSSPDDPLRNEVDAAQEQLEPGWVSYRPPESIREGRTADLVVQVQRKTATTNPTDVPGEGSLVQEEIEVGTPMTAELSGEDFDIAPDGKVTRVLGSNRPAEWRWTVRPRSAGTKELRLELAVLLDADHAAAISSKVYTQSIDVRVDLVNTPLRLARSTGSFLGALGLTVAAIVGTVLGKWRRARTATAAAGAGGPPQAGVPAVSRAPDEKRRPPPKRTRRRRRPR
jgi:hypothetical protein